MAGSDSFFAFRCGHRFCRCCILQISRRSADGGKCPNCRADVAPVDPATHPADDELCAKIQSSMTEDEIAARGSAATMEMDRLLTVAMYVLVNFLFSCSNISRLLFCRWEFRALVSTPVHALVSTPVHGRRALPVFAMRPGCRPGQSIALHLFEPRYQEMVRRVMATEERLFMCQPISPTLELRRCTVPPAGPDLPPHSSHNTRMQAPQPPCAAWLTALVWRPASRLRFLQRAGREWWWN